MNCKFCQGEIDEGTAVCPHCGELLVEKKEKKQVDARLAWVAIALCAILLAALVAVVVHGINSNGNEHPTEPVPSQTTAPTTPGTTEPAAESAVQLGLPDIGTRASYTVSADALKASADTVVATMGDQALTGEQLQVFYWMQYIDFMSYYGYYAYYMGLDETLPMDQQTLPNSTITWEQYFLDGAIQTWHRYLALSLEAKEAGFELEQALKDNLAAMPENLQKSADEGGYASVQEMIDAEMGPGCTLEAYLYYTELYYVSVSYFNALYETLDPTEDEIKDYFDAHAEEFAAQGITEASAPYVDVRHILLMPTGGTADASGNVTYSEAEWETCRQEAQKILDTWLAGEATEESFAELANTHSKDGGSNTTGGLYTYVTDDGTYVPEFTAWCMDESRQVGDTGLVKTEYGYHIMYFGRSEEAWHLYARDSLLSELSSEKMEQAMDRYPLEYDLSLIQVGSAAVATEPDPTEPTTAE